MKKSTVPTTSFVNEETDTDRASGTWVRQDNKLMTEQRPEQISFAVFHGQQRQERENKGMNDMAHICKNAVLFCFFFTLRQSRKRTAIN